MPAFHQSLLFILCISLALIATILISRRFAMIKVESFSAETGSPRRRRRRRLKKQKQKEEESFSDKFIHIPPNGVVSKTRGLAGHVRNVFSLADKRERFETKIAELNAKLSHLRKQYGSSSTEK